MVERQPAARPMHLNCGVMLKEIRPSRYKTPVRKFKREKTRLGGYAPDEKVG